MPREAIDRFGWSVSMDDDGHTIAVGATHEDSDGTNERNAADGANSGAAYIFEGILIP